MKADESQKNINSNYITCFLLTPGTSYRFVLISDMAFTEP